MRMTTFWHIAHPAWIPGQPLRSRNALTADGIDIPWLWDEADEGTDCDVVCLFPDTDQGRMEAQWLSDDRPGYTILRVELPDDTNMGRAEWEGYPTIDEVPGECLTVVERVGT